MKQRAFTLIELLTVMAVSVILLGIITFPLVQGFNLTRAAQSFADAQEKARLVADQVSREVSNAASVRDTSGTGGQVVVFMPSDPNYDRAIDGYVPVLLENAKIDLLMPSAGEPEVGSSGALRNPDIFDDVLFQADFPGLTPGTDAYILERDRQRNNPRYWKEDPTLRTPRGQVLLPAADGTRLVRYFVGLNRPLSRALNGAGEEPAKVPAGQQAALIQRARYSNPYDNTITRAGVNEDNLFVIRRAEVELRTFDRVSNSWQVSSLLDADGDGELQTEELDDPYFFVPGVDRNGNPITGAALAAKAQRVRQWLDRSRVLTELSRFDAIQPIFDRNTRRVVYDGATPRVLPLISFAPTRISSEPAAGQSAVRSGEETDNAVKLGPDVFTTDFGAYSNLFMRVWPSSYRAIGGTAIVNPWEVYQPWSGARQYHVFRRRLAGGQVAGFSQFTLPANGDELADGVEVFDVTAYEAARNAGTGVASTTLLPAPTAAELALAPFPFSFAIARANTRSNWLNDVSLREDFIPMVPDRRSGKVLASFAITEVGNGSQVFLSGQDNRPFASAGAALIPTADGTIGAPSNTRFQQPLIAPSSATSRINQRFNALWNDWNLVAPGLDRAKYCDRFVDLRFLPNADGSPSPLHPTEGFPRARIVAGSEVIFGPDQTGLSSQLVRYNRTTDIDNVGPNEYYIQYVNVREPENRYAGLGFTGIPANIYEPTFYDASNFVSAILQPRFRAGYVKFNSAPNQPIPDANISIFYRFQFTEPNDVLAVDYDSRQKINVTLTIRTFPQGGTTPNAQNVTVRSEATVRNLLR